MKTTSTYFYWLASIFLSLFVNSFLEAQQQTQSGLVEKSEQVPHLPIQKAPLKSLIKSSINGIKRITPTIIDSDINYKIEDIGGKYDIISSEVSELFQDEDGFIWVGNQTGLSRFDGYEFRNFTQADGSEIGQINAIVQDMDGILWAGGINGLYWYDSGQFHLATTDDYYIKDMCLDEDKVLWVAGFDFVPFILTSSERKQIVTGQKINSQSIVTEKDWMEIVGSLKVWSMDTDKNGVAWFGLDFSIAHFDGKKLWLDWQGITQKTEYCAVNAFHKDSIFWGSEEVGLIFQRGDTFVNIDIGPSYIMHKTDSSMYFVTPEELMEYKNNQWIRIQGLDEIGYIYPKELLLDKEGNFWLGGIGSLHKFTPAHVQSWNHTTFPRLASSHSISELPNGNIIIGSYRGKVVRKNEEGFTDFTQLDIASYSYVSDVHVDKRGWIWYATSASGIAVDRGGTITYLSTKDGLVDNSRIFFYEDTKGELWTGSYTNISRIRIDNNEISFDNYLPKIKDKAYNKFNDIFEGPDNSMWIISERGLYKKVGGDLIHRNLLGVTAQYPVFTGVAQDLDNQIWLSTQGQGLWQCYFTVDAQLKKIKQWTRNEGLLSDALLDVHVDKWGRIWTVAQNGISYLTATDTTWLVRTIDQDYGWPKQATYHSKFFESNDSLWVLNFTNLQNIPLYNLPFNQVSPQSYITKIQLFEGRENVFQYAKNDLMDGKLPEQLVLPYNKNTLRFYFTTTSYTQPSKNNFRYRLNGLDSAWYDFQETRSILYPSLPAGKYSFEVLAINNDGIKGEQTTSYSFSISPPWWATTWAYVIYALLFFSVLYTIYRFLLHKKLSEAETTRLRELDQVKTKLYTNITHEFRTPLTVIQGMADELDNRPNHEPKEKLRLIKKNSQNLLILVNQMLDLSKLEAGKINKHLQQGDIIAFLKYITENHESFAKLHNIDLQFYSETAELLMDFDKKKMEQILINLIGNAIKFTPAYGKVLVVGTKRDNKPTPQLEIKVKDTGIGIAADQLPYIFDRFHQSHNQKTAMGTGIGLTLVKELVNLMEGRIIVKSELKRGTTFTLTFPVQNKMPLNTSNKTYSFQQPITVQAPTPSLLKNGNLELPMLLIIEDNIDVIYYLQNCLETDYQIITAMNGKEGLNKAFETVPDIIISDVMMPEMDGFEVCQQLKKDERTNHIPIILLTAKATQADKLEGLSYGADAYLLKPFEKKELLLRLQKLRELRLLLQIKYSQQLISAEIGDSKKITPVDSFMRKVEGLILENLIDKDFSSEQLSKFLFLSRSQTHRKIKAITGMSTAIYIRHIRLQKAKQLLITHQEMTISEVAYQVGFKTPVYFSQAYKEVFGESPSFSRKL